MELVQDIEDLDNPDKRSVHWFCPRSTTEDDGLYYDEDLSTEDLARETKQEKATRLSRIEEAIGRKEKAVLTSKLLAFDGADAAPYQEKLKSGLARQLTRCDICIREFHRSRKWLRDQLEQEFDKQDVDQFLHKFDTMNKARIVAGLDSATETLLDLPPEERRINSAGDQGMYAMFEALNCLPFLRDEDALQSHLDRPFFQLAQSGKKKRIALSSVAPGTIAFLFSSDPDRYPWAERNMTKLARPLHGNEFEHSVKPFLLSAMARVNIVSLEVDYLPIFWRGAVRIISKLDKGLIDEHLRSMDVNFYTAGLEHFQIDGSHYDDLISTYKLLLEKSGTTFWDAMGTISPQNVIDTICRSPGLERQMQSLEDHHHGRHVYLAEQLTWLDAFVASIKAQNLVTPLRTVLDLCLKKYQGDEYPHYASSVALEKGLFNMLEGIKFIMSKVDGGPVYTHLVEAIGKDYIEVVMEELNGIEQKNEVQISKLQLLALQIVEHVLAMDVRGLARDRRMVEKHRELDHEIGLSSLQVWKKTIRYISPGHPSLVMAILAGITGLLPLEPLPPLSVKQAPKSAESWNHALSRTRSYISSDFLDRLDAFSPDQLVDVFQDISATKGFMSLLFNSDTSIHTGALGILKTLSSQDSRRDSLMHVVLDFFNPTLRAIADSLKLISDNGVFEPCTTMLKLLRDVFDCLCNPQDGILRSASLKKGDDLALRVFWVRTWDSLQTIFDRTETWSSLGHAKENMMDFCRETMDFADFAFDQYSVIAGVLRQAQMTAEDSTDAGKQLLQTPNKAFQSIIKWLRLRDEFLISKAVNLTTKILGRLREVDIKVLPDASEFVENIVFPVKNPQIRTKLKPNEKAELQRALEEHLGKTLQHIDETNQVSQKKQSSLQGWAVSGAGEQSRSGSSTPVGDSKKNVLDFEAWGLKAAQQKKQDFKPMQKLPTLAQQKLATKQKEEQHSFLLKRKQAQAEQEKQKQAAIAKLGAGSGVSGIGNLGKDHSTPGQTVMVDDDDLEAEDEEDEDVDDDLFGLATKTKKSARAQLDVSGTVGLKPEAKLGPTKIARTNRSAKDMRARLKPDLSPLHHIILGWDYFFDGDYPPNSRQDDFQAVQNSFRDPSSYQATFEPLLTLEAWQGLVKERGESTSKPYEIQVKNRSNVDRFIEINSIIGHAENRDQSLMEGDIILLSKAAKPTRDPEAPHCLARVYRMKKQKAHFEVTYQLLPSSKLAAVLTPQTIIHGQKVQSITPLEREYGALKSLQYYDLCHQIVNAKPSNRFKSSETQLEKLKDVYNLNNAQSEAVSAALLNEGFSLIQGPPGTGKTKTIVAIVGGILSQTLSSSGDKGATRIAMPKGSGSVSNDTPSKKLLVCAPSNAAVDEIVLRLKAGVKTRSGKEHQINVVRIGRGEAVNSQVADVTMEELVQKKTGGNNNDAKQHREKNAELFKEHSQVSQELRELYDKRDAHSSGREQMSDADRKRLDETIVGVRNRKTELSNRIDNVKDQERNAGREQEMNYQRARQAVIDEAHVICATLSGSGHDMFSTLSVEFETVIIDEAAQCVEASSLIPLKYGCIKCIMVGDPKQLPPTVFSKEAAKFQYEQSLFVRMQNNSPSDVHLLDTQYRMHPDISLFPSRSFYDGMLMDGQGMVALRKQPWHVSALLAPYRFFDVKGQHKSAASGNSLINMAEIDVAMWLYDRLIHDFKDQYDFNKGIGIITTYKAQLREMKTRFKNKYGPSIDDYIEFNTTDAFQGRECEIIIFSCVRASPVGGIGFLQDIRRMNVGLTRAKSSLWVLGNSQSLSKGQYWKKLIEDARDRDSYTTGNLQHMLQQPSSAFPASESNTRSMLDVNSHQADMEDEEFRRLESNDVKMRDAPLIPERKPSVREIDMNDAPFDDPNDQMSGRKRTFAASLDGPPDTNSRASVPQKVKITTGEQEGLSVTPASNQSASGSRDATPQTDGANTSSRATPAAQVNHQTRKKPSGNGVFIQNKRRPGAR